MGSQDRHGFKGIAVQREQRFVDQARDRSDKGAVGVFTFGAKRGGELLHGHAQLTALDRFGIAGDSSLSGLPTGLAASRQPFFKTRSSE